MQITNARFGFSRFGHLKYILIKAYFTVRAVFYLFRENLQKKPLRPQWDKPP